MTAAITTAAGAATDGGRRRVNEDAALASSPCFLVADGMGGHDAGDIASAAAVGAFAHFAGRDFLTVDEVRDAVEEVRARLDRFSASHESGAGTTLTGAVVAEVHGEGYWMILNVGDSRTYRLSGGRLEQLTVDHSVVQEMVDAGTLAEESARTDARRHIVTRALGAGNAESVDMWMFPAHVGDRILACSDGVTGELDDRVIADVLRTTPDPRQAAAELVRRAIAAGGRDNATAIVVDARHVAHAPRIAAARDDEIDVATIERSGSVASDTIPRSGLPGSDS
ncbi:PP2C family protein-serine/threonine phosphatase [Microbacterium excoecariae]|uniref:PP2C family protein-serine/threonine phosphatase n=1 Tax=Microbacterium excoecariae TaxID=2715210 RepID=UPI00140ADB0A|nr:protein phosphatase 2C domain-containing protein [Microbacterium excoecariae]NHI16207.1 serine/threonine-protein phosphatase [Microbacterium excoecariae]